MSFEIEMEAVTKRNAKSSSSYVPLMANRWLDQVEEKW